MLRDARIRLEGRLELVERAMNALTTALVEPTDFTRLALAIDQMSSEDTREAERQLMRLAREDAELQKIVDAAWDSKQRAAQVVFARAKALGVPQSTVSDTAYALAREQVNCEVVARNPWTLFQLYVVVIASVVVAVATRHWLALSVYVVPMAIITVLHFVCGVRIIVTHRRLVMGRLVVPLEHIARIELTRLFTRSPRPFRATIQLRSGQEAEVRLPTVPDELVAALKREGIEIDRHFWPWT